MVITVEQLTSLVGATKAKLMIDELNICFEKYNINTKLRICHFMAQALHESGGFSVFTENLNYSKDGLLKTFPKYFDSITALKYARNPMMIANRVYANRMGNGTEESGEPSKYIGRGIFQNTGKINYKKLSDEFKIDFINNPVLLATPKYATISAGFYWNSNNLNVYADKDDILTITKRINGGTNGLDDRTNWLNKCKKIII